MPIKVVFAEQSQHVAGKFQARNNVDISADIILIPHGPGDLIGHCARVHGLLEAFGVMPISGKLTFVIEERQVKTSGTLTKHSDRIGTEPDHLIAKIEKIMGEIARDYGQLFSFVKWEMTQSCIPPTDTSASADA